MRIEIGNLNRVTSFFLVIFYDRAEDPKILASKVNRIC